MADDQTGVPDGWEVVSSSSQTKQKSARGADEPAFRNWYAGMSKSHGLNPNPDSPEQHYDYRSAFRAGAKPDASGHWPSDFKQAGHENLVVGGFNTKTGERVPGTKQASEQELIKLGWEPATAARLSKSGLSEDKADVPDGYEVVTATPSQSAPSKGRDFKLLGVNIHVPPEEKPRLDSNIATVGGIGIAPEDALMVGQGVRGVAAATKAGGALAGVKAAAAHASPVIKYEATKSGLEAIGVPAPLAMGLAYYVSGYKRGAKPTEAPTPSPADSPHLDLSQRVPAGALTQQQIGERLSAARQQGMTAPHVEPVKNPAQPVRVPLPERPTTPPGPPEPSVTAEPFNAPRVKPPSPKELNEQAIQRHRAIVTAARENGVELKPGDLDALKVVVQSGVAPEEAVSALKASRTVTPKSAAVEEAMTQSSRDPAAELARRFNLPSDAERTFPPNKSGLPTKPPTARKARGKIADLAEIKSP